MSDGSATEMEFKYPGGDILTYVVPGSETSGFYSEENMPILTGADEYVFPSSNFEATFS